MPKPRTPKAKAAVTGQADKKRTKFDGRKEPKPIGPLGDPPEWLVDTDTNKARSAWELFRREIPWLTESHRLLVGMAANIQGRIMAGQECGVQAMNLLRQMLGQMGATPADSSKITVPDDEGEKDDLLD
jgi:hypothetical protein